jgi:para-aminobenzoate synthetase / 4-amino-4-deoxychorismate lyase
VPGSSSLDRVVAGHSKPARTRVLLSRDGRVDVALEAMPPVPTGPVLLAVDDDPVDSGSPWLQHKSTRRNVYATRALRHPEADDVVLVNERAERG